MQKIYLITTTILFVAMVSCNENKTGKASTDAIHMSQTADSSNLEKEGMAMISFTKTVHDFGKITQGEKAEYSFKFTNTGTQQLLLSNVAASCGCTVPQYSKEPINPGESGFIKVIFDSDKRLDKFEKSLTVSSNTNPSETVLYITGMVIPKPEDQLKMLNE